MTIRLQIPKAVYIGMPRKPSLAIDWLRYVLTLSPAVLKTLSPQQIQPNLYQKITNWAEIKIKWEENQNEMNRESIDQ